MELGVGGALHRAPDSHCAHASTLARSTPVKERTFAALRGSPYKSSGVRGFASPVGPGCWMMVDMGDGKPPVRRRGGAGWMGRVGFTV